MCRTLHALGRGTKDGGFWEDAVHSAEQHGVGESHESCMLAISASYLCCIPSPTSACFPFPFFAILVIVVNRCFTRPVCLILETRAVTRYSHHVLLPALFSHSCLLINRSLSLLGDQRSPNADT